MSSLRLCMVFVAGVSLAGCDIPYLNLGDSPEKREADGKAIGGACRHALRGIEDCYNLNPAAHRPAVFAGWKEMDQYMRDNAIEGKPTVIPVPAPPAPPTPAVPPPPKEEVVETKDEAPPKAKSKSK